MKRMTDRRLEELTKGFEDAIWNQDSGQLTEVLYALGKERATKAQLKRLAEAQGVARR